MNIHYRYGLLLVTILGYYVQFFVPLFSLTTVKRIDSDQLALLKGFSLYDYHYMSVGIMPFVFSSIIMQLFRWVAPPIHQVLASNAKTAERNQIIIAYFLSIVYILFLLYKIPHDRYLYASYVTFFELLLSVFLTQQIFEQVKKTQTMASPVMLFLGLNVLGAIILQIIKIDYSSGFVNKVFWLGLTLLCASFLYFLTKKIERLSEIVYFKRVDFIKGTSTIKIPVKIVRTGITPLIYTSFILFPLLIILSYKVGLEEHSAHKILISYPWLYLILLMFILFFSYKLTSLGLPVEQLKNFCRKSSVFLIDKKNKEIANENFNSFFKGMIVKHSLIATVWFFALFLLGDLWFIYAPNSVSSLHLVGGTSVVLLYFMFSDLIESYKKLKEEVAYAK